MPDPVPLDEVYDEQTLSLIDAHAGASRIRRGVGGAVLAGAMIGLADVFEPEPDKQAVIEYVPDAVDRHDRAVEFVFVRGAPARSRIIFRPWLMG